MLFGSQLGRKDKREIWTWKCATVFCLIAGPMKAANSRGISATPCGNPLRGVSEEDGGCVCMCVMCMHVYVSFCYMLQFWDPKKVPQCFVLYCFIAFMRWAFTHPWCNRLLVCSFWKASICHGTTNLSYWTCIVLLFHGLCVNGWHFFL